MSARNYRRNFLFAIGGAAAGFIGAFFGVPKSVWLTKRRLELGKENPDLEPEIVDISALEPGQSQVVSWRNRTIYVTRRTDEMLAQHEADDRNLYDADSVNSEQPAAASNALRSIRRDIFVFDSTCTHLGCPVAHVQAGELKRWPSAGYFCACHGAQFDLAGRVVVGSPAPLNLIIPPHHYQDENTLVIGSNA